MSLAAFALPATGPATDAAAGPRLLGLPPVVSPQTRVLVLGSFPGEASLKARQYYAHPRNQFWPLLQVLWPQHLQPNDYLGRCAWLLARGLGLWDVYGACVRAGSLDSAIREAQVNDFAALRAQCPGLQAVVHNGGESFRHARAVQQALGREGVPLPVLKLPSTSPANASWSFERKRAAWAQALAAQGLC